MSEFSIEIIQSLPRAGTFGMADKQENLLPRKSTPSMQDLDNGVVDEVSLSPDEQMDLAALRFSIAELQYKIDILLARARAREMLKQGKPTGPGTDSLFDDNHRATPLDFHPDLYPDHTKHPRHPGLGTGWPIDRNPFWPSLRDWYPRCRWGATRTYRPIKRPANHTEACTWTFADSDLSDLIPRTLP